MIRNLKALGLALVAVFAMGALIPSSASATDFFTTANQQKALLTGVGHNHVFNANGTKFECTTSALAATVAHGASETTVDVRYTGKIGQTPHNTDGSPALECNSSGGDIIVDMNSCGFRLTGDTTGEDEGADAKVIVYCDTPGDVIKITGAVTMTVGPQIPVGGVIYANEPNHPGGAAVKVTATATGVTYTCHGFACHFGPGTHGIARYTGEVTVTGYEDKEGLPTSVTEGNRVGVSVS